jgi:hypothetical protein
MKLLHITTIILFLCIHSYGQDGSDIRYLQINGVDSSLIGQYVHFDFFNRSFRMRSIDTVTITIDNKRLKFKEVRKDNGYNNWFSQQSLQSVDNPEGTINIQKLRLDNITANAFQVTMYVEYYENNNHLLIDKATQIVYWFDKKDITEVLVKSKQR